jgi:radical SAM superfamily enzyme YgiQ (UPF0313 family)
MKVLLVSANTEQFNMPVMPLGLACVAAAAGEAGHDVIMVDLMFEMDAGAVLEKSISEFNPECIGISVRNIDDQNYQSPAFLLDKVKEVVAICRILSAAPVVLGGAGYSMFPEDVLSYLSADMGIEGEGDIVFTVLLDRLAKHADPAEIPGLRIRGAGLRQPKVYAGNLDRLPLPGTNILSSSASKNRDPWIPVQTRRGCPLKCSYCSTPAIEGAIIRKRSPEIVVAWLESWVRAGYRNFYFVDNTFNLPSGYAKEICRKITEKGLDISWWCILYPKNVDRELAELMAKAGCRQVSLGFESGSERILKNLNKRFSPGEVRIISGMFADYGIERFGFLLLGSPGETRETVGKSLAFAESLALDALKLTAGVRIYPGTELAVIAEKEGIIFPRCNLLYPRFYLAGGLEEWLPETLNKWKASCSCMVR